MSGATRPDQPSIWLNRFAWLTAVTTLFLICSGGMVTSKGVGLAVPDWPTTFGYNMFFFPVSHWVGGIFFEHTHRLIASAVGFLTIILALWLWRAEDRRWVRSLGWFALVGVILQGVLGGLRVTMLKDEIGVFHACLAQAFFGLLVFIALVTSRFWRSLSHAMVDRQKFRPLKTLAFLTTAAIYLQLGLGATIRHQHRDLAILDFPTANGSWIPDTSADTLAKINTWRDARALSNVTAFQIRLQMAHRFGALLVAIGVIGLFVSVRRNESASLPGDGDGAPPRRLSSSTMRASHLYGPANRQDLHCLKRLSTWWLILVLLQMSLGAWTIWSNKAADIATAHVAVGAIMLSFGVIISAICWRLQSAWHGLPARGGSEPTGKMPVPQVRAA
jgi:heme a synthase